MIQRETLSTLLHLSMLSMATAISMCNNASTLDRENINIFTDLLHRELSNDEKSLVQRRNTVMSPLAVWFLASKETQQDSVCRDALAAVESELHHKYSKAGSRKQEKESSHSQLTDTDSIKIIRKFNDYRHAYMLIKLLVLSVKVRGVINPQIKLKALPLLNRPTLLVPVLDFYIDVNYDTKLAFNTTFLTVPLSEDSRLKMLIIIPGRFLSFKQSIQLFRDAQADGWTIPGSSTNRIVHVELPTFKVTSTLDMTTSLRNLGLKNAFNNTALHKLENLLSGSIVAIIQNSTIILNDFYDPVTREEINESRTSKMESFVVDKPFIVEITYDNVLIFTANVVDLN